MNTKTISTARVRGFLFGAALVAATLPLASIAHADEPVDTVVLSNGGRVRGTVVESEAKTGTTIRLLDGTTRKLKPADIVRVDYGEESLPAPAPALSPVPAPTGASGGAASSGASSALLGTEGDSAQAPAKTQMRSSGAFVAGTILVSLGAVAGIAGAVLFAANSQTKDASYQNCSNIDGGPGGPCRTEHQAYTNTTGKTDGEVLLAVGSVGMVTGLVIALVGAQRVPVKRAGSAQSLSIVPTVGLRSVGLTMHF